MLYCLSIIIAIVNAKALDQIVDEKASYQPIACNMISLFRQQKLVAFATGIAAASVAYIVIEVRAVGCKPLPPQLVLHPAHFSTQRQIWQGTAASIQALGVPLPSRYQTTPVRVVLHTCR